MGSIGNPRDYLILTNNPMVKSPERFIQQYSTCL